MARYGDENARWVTPRPGYMREIEPQAHPCVWPSEGVGYIDKAEQAFNRQLFSQGRNRKQPARAAAAGTESGSERQTG
jgi:hypothetical protein